MLLPKTNICSNRSHFATLRLWIVNCELLTQLRLILTIVPIAVKTFNFGSFFMHFPGRHSIKLHCYCSICVSLLSGTMQCPIQRIDDVIRQQTDFRLNSFSHLFSGCSSVSQFPESIVSGWIEISKRKHFEWRALLWFMSESFGKEQYTFVCTEIHFRLIPKSKSKGWVPFDSSEVHIISECYLYKKVNKLKELIAWNLYKRWTGYLCDCIKFIVIIDGLRRWPSYSAPECTDFLNSTFFIFFETSNYSFYFSL